MVVLEWLYEYWLPVRGYEGLYDVSNWGRVRSLNYQRTGKTKIMIPIKNTYGYYCVPLYKSGKRKNVKIHRLVAEAFLPNPDKLPQVNHKSENKIENGVWNLEWCDNKYNSNYGSRNERMLKTRANKAHKNAEKPVLQYTKNMVFVERYISQAEASRETGIPNSHICRQLKGRRKSAGGYIWQYE